MKTSFDFARAAAIKYGIPEEQALEYYYAMVDGLRDRINEGTILSFNVKGLGTLNFSYPLIRYHEKYHNRAIGRRRRDKLKKQKASAIIDTRPGHKNEVKYTYYCPMFFYGRLRGFSEDDIKERQDEFLK